MISSEKANELPSRDLIQFEFSSKNLGKTVTSKDLEELDRESLVALEAEVDYTTASILAKVKWSETSQPSEWPDEDWPRRVLAALVFHEKFLKRVRNALLRFKKEDQMEREIALLEAKQKAYKLNKETSKLKEAKRQQSQEKHLAHQERLAKINYLRTKYIYQVLTQKCGKAFADDVFNEAHDLADSNVDSATWKD